MQKHAEWYSDLLSIFNSTALAIQMNVAGSVTMECSAAILLSVCSDDVILIFQMGTLIVDSSL